MTTAFHPLKVLDVRRETPGAVSIAFAVPPALAGAFRFQPGQHLTLRRNGGEEIRRSYSICSAPGDGEIRIAVKKVEGGSFSGWANEALACGDEIDVMVPQGRFGVAPDPAAARTILAIAAGSGITPIMSIMRAILEGEPQSRFILLYGNRDSQNIIFKDAIDDLKDRFLTRLTVYHVLSREEQEIGLLTGRIDGEKIAAVVRAAGGPGLHGAFLCGPGGMIEEARTALAALGVARDRIHAEYFSTDGLPVAPRRASAARAPDDSVAVATAVVTLDGAQHEVPMLADETVVEAGLRRGLAMPYSCRGGMCCTCRAMLVEGEVEMAQNYSLEAWEIEAGFVLTCQSRPKTSRVVLDYDQV